METPILNVKYDGMYKSFSATAGKVTTKFRYTVDGTPEAMAAYAKSQGAQLRKKDLHAKGDQLGAPLFFSNKFIGTNATLNKSQNNEGWFPNQEKLEQANSLAEQFPALAGAIAQSVIGSAFGSASAVAATPVTKEEEEIGKV